VIPVNYAKRSQRSALHRDFENLWTQSDRAAKGNTELQVECLEMLAHKAPRNDKGALLKIIPTD